MEDVINKVRQEAAARIIEEYKQWLTQVVEGEKIIKEAAQEAVRDIAESRQKVEQIAAQLKNEDE